MKFYATMTSERDSRPAKKGGDNYIRIELTSGNRDAAIIVLQAGTLRIHHRPELIEAQLSDIMPSDIPW